MGVTNKQSYSFIYEIRRSSASILLLRAQWRVLFNNFGMTRTLSFLMLWWWLLIANQIRQFVTVIIMFVIFQVIFTNSRLCLWDEIGGMFNSFLLQFLPGGYTWTTRDANRPCTAVQQLRRRASVCYRIRRSVWRIGTKWIWPLEASLLSPKKKKYCY